MCGFEIGHVQNGVVLVLEIHTDIHGNLCAVKVSTGTNQHKRDFLPNKNMLELRGSCGCLSHHTEKKVEGGFQAESNCLGCGQLLETSRSHQLTFPWPVTVASGRKSRNISQLAGSTAQGPLGSIPVAACQAQLGDILLDTLQHPGGCWGITSLVTPLISRLGKRVVPCIGCSETLDLQRISLEFTCLHGISSHRS